MKAEGVKRKADEVADDLLRRIVSGQIPTGKLLPRESDLAARYGVNRSVVREANKLLEVHRLVRPTRRKGTVALDPLCSVTPAVLSAMLTDRKGRVDPHMLAEFIELRAHLEVKMAELAAVRRNEQDLFEIEHAVASIEAAPPGSSQSFDSISAFGVAVARASKNRIFVMLAHWHADIARELMPLLARVRAPVAKERGHRLLLEALRSRDAELASKLVEEFHRWAGRRLLELVNEDSHAKRSRRKSAPRS